MSLVGVVTAVTSAITGAVVSVVEVVVLSEVVVVLSATELLSLLLSGFAQLLRMSVSTIIISVRRLNFFPIETIVPAGVVFNNRLIVNDKKTKVK